MKRHGWLVTGMMMAASAACLGGQDRLTVLVVDQTGVASGDIANAIDLSRGVFDIRV